jgi:dipeptidyl-peptidase-4
LTATDGKTKLYGSLILPAGNTANSIPLILNPYGGTHAQSVRNTWGGPSQIFDQLLAQHGFAVLRVDNRGMGSRGRDFEQAAYHNFGPIQFDDQMAALDQVLALYPQLDPKRLGFWGWSWGASFTLYAMTHSDRFKAGVAVAPVTDWKNYDSIYTERYLGLPAENQEVYKNDADVTAAKNLKGHLLMAHGTGDDNVHFANSIQMMQALIDADIPFDFQAYPRKTHSIAGQEARTHLFTRILWNFETYLK